METPQPVQNHQGVSVKVIGLHKHFGGQEVLKGIDFEVNPGEIFVIMGPSGSGKSVLLKHVIGLEAADAGEILIDGKSIYSPEVMENYRLAMVFQSGALLNSLTVGENVGLYLVEHRLKPPKEIDRIVKEKLELVGLKDQEDKLPSELGATHSTAALVAASLFVCAVAPICEEFFFRGFVFGALRNIPLRVGRVELGPWIAAVLTGILFGLAHTGSASSQYLVPLGFLGFVLCLVRWRTRSLYPCMALHSANNALALGVNQLSWSALAIVGLVIASWLVIAAVTGPLAPREPRPA